MFHISDAKKAMPRKGQGISLLDRIHALRDAVKHFVPAIDGCDVRFTPDTVQKRENNRIGADVISDYFKSLFESFILDGYKDQIGRLASLFHLYVV